jgi:phenylacetate-coenzyme A ligase PaaK-like adenylate-forming protein
VSLSRVRRLLEQLPDFSFDVEHYLLGLSETGNTERTFRSFLHSFSEIAQQSFAETAQWPSVPRIDRWLSGNEKHEFIGYKDYPNAFDPSAVPLLSKRSVRANIEHFYRNDYYDRSRWLRPTTGSSGRPIDILYSNAFHFDLLHLSPRKAFARAAVEADPDLTILSLSEHLHFPKVVTLDSSVDILVLHSVVDTSLPSTFKAAFELMKKFQPVCLSSKPSVLENLLTIIARDEGIPKLHSIISGGACLSEELRARLAAAFRCPIINIYGMTEVGVIASECSAGSLHIDASSLFVEAVDDEGSQVPPGTAGEVVVSRVDNELMPFLRYRTGDTGEIATEPCACGVVGPRIKNLSGRRIACFRLPSGDVFAPTRFNEFMGRFPAVEEYQMTQRRIDHIEVGIEFCDSRASWNDLRDRVHQYFRSIFPCGMRIEVQREKFPIDSKFQRFRSDI